MRFHLPAAGVCPCLLAMSVAAAGGPPQSGAGAASGPPARVHVFVTTADGRPVPDLLAEEVTLKVAGRTREIRSLTATRIPTATDAAKAGAAPPPPYATNRPPEDGRDILIVLDNESFGTGRETLVRDALDNLLKLVAPSDRVGVVTVPKGLSRLAPTADHARAAAAITEMVNRGLRTEVESDTACRTKSTLDALRQLFSMILPERLTVVVFFSGGLTPPTAIQSIARGTGAVATCEVRTDDYSEVVNSIQAAPVDFFAAFVPEDFSSGAPPSANLVTGLEHVAGAGGNGMIRLTGSDRSSLSRMVEHSSAFYTVAFDPDPADRTNTAQRLEIRVSRNGATARARQALVLAKPSAPQKRAKGTSPDELLRVAASYGDVPLRAAAFPARGDDRKSVKVAVLFEPTEAGRRLTAAAVALYDEKGKVVAKGSAQETDLKRSPAVLGLQAQPGTYRLRVAATDASGLCGTVDQDVTLGLTPAEPLSLSSLVLGRPVDGRFTPTLELVDTPTAIAYVEVYGVTPGAQLEALYELAGSADGPAFATLPVDVRPGASPDLRIVLGEIPLALLPPGDVVVRAIVGLSGQPPGTVVRTLRRR